MTASAITALRSPDWASHFRLETADGEIRTLADCEDSWQRSDRLALENGFRAMAGLPVDDEQPAYLRAWLERPRGHAKTSDLGILSTRALLVAQSPINAVAAAADKDQASLLRDSIFSHVRANGWAGILDVQRFTVRNTVTGSSLTILSSDVPSSFGLTPHLVIADEVCHWASRDLWDSLLSSAAKRARCLFVSISNAGFAESWQHDTREAIRSDSAWYFSRLDGPVASWITADRLDEQRRLLPDVVYRRLWLNIWASGAGDALRQEDIAAAFHPDMTPVHHAAPGWGFAAGVDLSVSQDHSAVAIIGKSKAGRYRLAKHAIWRPAGEKIDQSHIEQYLLDAHKAFRFAKVAIDPFQGEYICSRLRKAGVPVETRYQTGKGLLEQCMFLIECFAGRNLDLYESDQLRDELKRLRVEERSYGMRLVADKTPQGHSDLTTAISIGLTAAKSISAGFHDLSDWMSSVQEQRIRQLGIQRREQESFRAWNRPVDEREIRRPWLGGL